jgi:hypothetical protein
MNSDKCSDQGRATQTTLFRIHRITRARVGVKWEWVPWVARWNQSRNQEGTGMRRIGQIARRRHGLVAVTMGVGVAIAVATVCMVMGGALAIVTVVLVGLALVCDGVWLGAEWRDEWRYQGLVDAWEASRHGMPTVWTYRTTTGDEWPVPHDMEERVDMSSAYDNGETYVGDPVQEAYAQGCWDAMALDDDVDVSDTQTGQGVE